MKLETDLFLTTLSWHDCTLLACTYKADNAVIEAIIELSDDMLEELDLKGSQAVEAAICFSRVTDILISGDFTFFERSQLDGEVLHKSFTREEQFGFCKLALKLTKWSQPHLVEKYGELIFTFRGNPVVKVNS